MPNQSNLSMDRIKQFHQDHQWSHHHNAKDLAISIVLEASELLEDFQWVDAQTGVDQNLENIKEELADILIYAYTLADRLDLDIDEIIADKLEKNLIKYPIPDNQHREDS